MSAPAGVRFAPSPTGYFHVGSARTALFNWLFARHHGGTFILRIEDTDEARNRPEWVEGILAALSWLGMDPDEGPYHQSAHTERYAAAVDVLWAAGALYACDCTREDVLARAAPGQAPGYDGHCRDRGLGPGEGRLLRFRVPDEGETVVSDVVRGQVVFPHAAMEDFAVVKSSGTPLFVLANVVDDRDMGITHVIRGEDLLPTTPKQVLLWEVLERGAPGGLPGGLPVFAHLPMLVNEQRKKLSKRRDPVSVELYRNQGYLAVAFCNYLALLGWSPPGELEKVPPEVLVSEFRLEEVHHAPAFFDVKKLTHLNGEYIRELAPEAFVAATRPWVAPDPGGWVPAPLAGPGVGGEGAAGPDSAAPGAPGTPDGPATRLPPWPPERFDPAVFAAMAPLVQERVAVLGEVPAMVDFLFLADPPMDDASFESAVARDPGALGILDAASAAYGGCAWEPASLHEATQHVADQAGRKLAKAQAPIRVAVTGRRVGPPLFDAMALLGRAEVLRRLAAARARAAGGEG